VTDPRPLDLTAMQERIAGRGGPAEPIDEPERVLVPRRDALWTARRPGQIPRKFLDANLADFRGEPEDVRSDLNGWAVRPDGRNLLILGPVGVGKSRAAVAACRRSHFHDDQTVDFWPVVELLDHLRPGGPPDALDRVMGVDVLILDDLGAERPTDWTFERLYALVNRRWLEELPTVATTNLPGSRRTAPTGHDGPTLDEVLGDRMFSRLVGGAVVVRLSGPDRRRTGA
jgi:DNA replication protein DnaC